jgi:flagellar export protein FliJ
MVDDETGGLMSPKTLSRILAVKQRVRLWKRTELAAANELVERAQRVVDHHDNEHRAASAAIVGAGELSGTELGNRAEAVARARAGLARASTDLDHSHRTRDDHHAQVTHASREVRVLENLHGRALQAQRQDERTREQKELDDTVATRRPRT